MASAAVSHDAEILKRLLQADAGSLSPDAARSLLAIKLDPAGAARMRELVAKAQDGMLTGQEEEELESYRRVGHLVELLWARARRALREANA